MRRQVEVGKRSVAAKSSSCSLRSRPQLTSSWKAGGGRLSKNRMLKEKPNLANMCKNNTEERDRSETRSKTQPYLGMPRPSRIPRRTKPTFREGDANRWLTVHVLRSHLGSDTATLNQFVCTATVGRLQGHLQVFHVLEHSLGTLIFPPGIGAAALASAKGLSSTQEPDHRSRRTMMARLLQCIPGATDQQAWRSPDA